MRTKRHTRRPIVATWYQSCFDGSFRAMAIDDGKNAVVSYDDMTTADLPEGIADRCKAVMLSTVQNYVSVAA